MLTVTPSQCQKYANVTPSQCQKNANRDAVWVLSITRGDHFLAFLGGKEWKNLILNYVALLKGTQSHDKNFSYIEDTTTLNTAS